VVQKMYLSARETSVSSLIK